MNLGAWIASLVPSLVGRVLAALGMGLVTVTGLTAVSAALLSYLHNAVGGVPADILNILALCGLDDALNILIGAITARLTLYSITQGSRIIGTAQ
jgi:hypothetical protein